MLKKMLAGVLAVLMLSSGALAEVYEGTVIAMNSVQAEAGATGVLDMLDVCGGEIVTEDESIGSVRTEKIFAEEDGTVAVLNADAGDDADGMVLEIMPVERYQIYCTVDKACQSAESTLVHSGEKIYMKCTANGTHRGVGIVTMIEDAEYRVLAVGGEFYVGETVYLYRDEEFSSVQRVGIGTVVTNDTAIYEACGRIVKMHVSEGEYVERGELLYEVAEGENEQIAAPATGIVTEIAAVQGDLVQEGQVVAVIVPLDQIGVEISVDETAAAQVAEGGAAELIFAADSEENPVQGTISDVFWIAEDGMYSVRIIPEVTEHLRLGQSVTVCIDE